MPADEALGGVVHRRRIERPRHPQRAAGVEGEIGAAVDDAVEVVALHRRKPRVEVIRRRLGGEHRDGMRPQMGIERVAHGVGVPGLGEIDMCDLAERVHAGIGAPSAMHMHGVAAERRDRGGEHALHRDAVVLHLPADEGAAVIFDGELEARHHASRVPAATSRAAQEFLGLHRLARRRAAVRVCAPRRRRRRW